MNKWFNQLPMPQRKLVLFAFCLLFAALLVLSIRYQTLKMQTGTIQQPRTKNK